ncbi:MAG: outer membrane beta-barrel protein [Burkholderiales bacterium]
MTAWKLTTIVLLALWASNFKPAFAQPQLDTGLYLGGGYGFGKAGVRTDGIAAALQRNGFTTVTTSADESSEGWKLFAGYQFHRNIAFEAGYADLGKFSAFAVTIPAGTTRQTYNSTGWGADLIAIWPFGNGFSIYGRGGVLFSETRTNIVNTGAVRSRTSEAKNSDVGYKLGMGLGYDFTRNWRVRGEWERYNVANIGDGHANVDFFSVSLLYKF